jgi:hypothetical protein
MHVGHHVVSAILNIIGIFEGVSRICQQILVIFLIIKFHEKLFSDFRTLHAHRRSDREHGGANTSIFPTYFCEHAVDGSFEGAAA